MWLVMHLVFLMGNSRPAWAENDTSGDKLYKYCRDGTNTWDESYCARKIIAILETNSGNGRQMRGLGICTPDGTTKGQLVVSVRAWLKNNPHVRQASELDLIARALAAAFPCR